MAKDLIETQKWLREPHFDPFSEQTFKVRRNLIIVATVLLSVHFSGVSINNFVIAGTKLDNLSERDVLLGLHILMGYFLIHFLWQAFDHLLEWRLRITGFKLSIGTGSRGNIEEGDYPDDPRNSSLSNWWADQAENIARNKKSVEAMLGRMANVEEYIDKSTDPNNPMNAGNISRSISSIGDSLTRLNNKIQRTEETITSSRIPASLSRYERWHKFVFTAQNFRFLVLDFGFPVALAIAALCFSVPDLVADAPVTAKSGQP